jgi:GNAT superfamily N-acetyltransferase
VDDVAITRLEALSLDHLAELVTESEQSGCRFVRRLVEEWEGGVNRFAQPGEALFAAVFDSRVVGVCGLNRDPFATSPGVGRVRRLYVLAAFRRRGIGRRLLREVVIAARSVFQSLRVRTGTHEAALLFAALGFRATSGVPDCTHVLELA